MKNKSVFEKAYAKINLFLEILDKREDGYHNIDTVMHSIALHDDVSLSYSDKISVNCSTSAPSGEKNIAYKAATKFFEYTNIDSGVDIRIDKRIPVCAGLGGGSADAAAVIRGLNIMYECGLTESEMHNIAAKIGADVPFCISGGCAIAGGIGEKIIKLPTLSGITVLVCNNRHKISTAEAYGKIDAFKYLYISPAKITDAIKSNDMGLVFTSMHNRFEDVSDYCLNVKNVLIDSGAEGALLSGSGSSVFGLFLSSDNADDAEKNVLKLGYEVYKTSFEVKK